MASTASTRMLALAGVPAVHGDRGAGDEIRGWARQKDGDPRHVLDRAPAPGRRPPEHIVVEAVDLATRILCELGVDPPGQHRVHLDGESAAPIARGPDEGAGRSLVAGAPGDAQPLTAELLEPSDGGGGLRLIARRRAHARPRARQTAGHAETDPSVAARDDRDA